ncbi:hypothetical protein GOP47_0029739 [Adiantum capillus-veneris]|nr:hypothetical protein GOP47_0029739 [Adiantum capillus-veneris]
MWSGPCKLRIHSVPCAAKQLSLAQVCNSYQRAPNVGSQLKVDFELRHTKSRSLRTRVCFKIAAGNLASFRVVKYYI